MPLMWLRGLIHSPRDGEEMEKRKSLVLWYCVVSMLMAILRLISIATNGEVSPTFLVVVFAGIVSASVLGYMIYTKRLEPRIVIFYFTVMSTCVALSDMYFQSLLSEGTWPLFIVILDTLVIMRFPDRVLMAFTGVFLFWISLRSVEIMVRFGLFDIPLLTASEGERREATACEKPPCAVGIPIMLTSAALQLCVVLFNFNNTRRFVKRVEREKEMLENGLLATESVANAMVDFDLEKAGEVLSMVPPSQITNVLYQLLSNLENYRPYLPTGIFEVKRTLSKSSTPVLRSQPPGAISKTAAIVFTDIESSTVIWEAVREKMRDALADHNAIIRQCLIEWNGYEVKTIGDSFMAAFDCAEEAVKFALQAQTLLFTHSWDDSLKDISACCTQGGIWNGLRIRIGVHYGDATPELNPLTSRFDYHGQLVNMTARVEGCGAGGGIYVTQVVRDLLTDKDCYIRDLGGMSLKGISGGTIVYLILPHSLANRTPEIIDTMSKKKSAACSPVVTSPRRMWSLAKHEDRMLQTTQSASLVLMSMKSEETENDGQLSELLSTVCSLVEQSGGTVVAVTGTEVSLGWNLQHECASHVLEAVYFTSSLHTILCRTGSCWEGLVVTGVGTGPASYGAVGSAKTRFYVTLGPALQRCIAVMRLNHELGISASFACDEAAKVSLQFFSRPVGQINSASDTILVYQLDTRDNDPGESWGWSTSYASAFSNHEIETIRQHAGDDAVLRVVADLLQDSITSL